MDTSLTDDRLRLIFTLPPPGVGAGGAGRVDAAPPRRTDDRRGRAAFLVPERRWPNGWSAPSARSRRRIPYRVPRDAELPDRLAGGPRGPLPRLHRGPHRDSADALIRARPARRSDPTRHARWPLADARRARGRRPAGADASARLAAHGPRTWGPMAEVVDDGPPGYRARWDCPSQYRRRAASSSRRRCAAVRPGPSEIQAAAIAGTARRAQPPRRSTDWAQIAMLDSACSRQIEAFAGHRDQPGRRGRLRARSPPGGPRDTRPRSIPRMLCATRSPASPAARRRPPAPSG